MRIENSRITSPGWRLARVLLLLCVLPSTALAADAVAPSATLTVFDDVVHVVGSALAIALMGLVTLGVQKLAQKWHLQVPQEWQSKINDSIDHGIAYAEEQAHKEADGKLAGGTKLDMASKYVLNLVGDDKKLVALGDTKLKQMIEARLSLSRGSETSTIVMNQSSAPAVSAPPLAPVVAADPPVVAPSSSPPVTESIVVATSDQKAVNYGPK